MTFKFSTQNTNIYFIPGLFATLCLAFIIYLLGRFNLNLLQLVSLTDWLLALVIMLIIGMAIFHYAAFATKKYEPIIERTVVQRLGSEYFRISNQITNYHAIPHVESEEQLKYIITKCKRIVTNRIVASSKTCDAINQQSLQSRSFMVVLDAMIIPIGGLGICGLLPFLISMGAVVVCFSLSEIFKSKYINCQVSYYLTLMHSVDEYFSHIQQVIKLNLKPDAD